MDQMGEVQGGRQRSPYYTDGILRPYLRVANVFDGYIDSSDVLKMAFTASEYERHVLKPGDVLLNEGQSLELVGRSAIYTGEPPDCCFQNTLIRFRPGTNADSAFAHQLFQYLLYQGSFAKIASRTTSVAHLGVSKFASMKAVWPPISEQRAIAAVLSAWNRAIEQNSKLLEAKRELRNGLMQRLAAGTLRFAGYDSDWTGYRIGDLVREEDRSVEWDDKTLYRLASVRRWNGGLFGRESLYGSQIKVKKLKTIRAGDFLISHIQGAYGAMALVPAQFDGAQVSDLYSVLIPRDEGTLDIRFFDYLSQTPRMRRKVYASCNGFFAERLRLNFSSSDFMKQTVRVPADVSEQRHIADSLDAITKEIILLERKLEALRLQKKGLMQKLLTGQVCVSV